MEQNGTATKAREIDPLDPFDLLDSPAPVQAPPQVSQEPTSQPPVSQPPGSPQLPDRACAQPSTGERSTGEGPTQEPVTQRDPVEVLCERVSEAKHVRQIRSIVVAVAYQGLCDKLTALTPPQILRRMIEHEAMHACRTDFVNFMADAMVEAGKDLEEPLEETLGPAAPVVAKRTDNSNLVSRLTKTPARPSARRDFITRTRRSTGCDYQRFAYALSLGANMADCAQYAGSMAVSQQSLHVVGIRWKRHPEVQKWLAYYQGTNEEIAEAGFRRGIENVCLIAEGTQLPDAEDLKHADVIAATKMLGTFTGKFVEKVQHEVNLNLGRVSHLDPQKIIEAEPLRPVDADLAESA